MAWRISRKRAIVGGAAALALVVGGYLGYYQLVRAGILKYNKYDRRERGKLRVGDPAPDLALAGYDGSTVRLSRLWADRPVVLVFGSCT